MADPKPPVIIDTGSELLLFSSIEKAEGYLEPIDVENHEYPAAYDSRGRPLELSIEKTPTSHLLGLLHGTSERVRIGPAPDGGTNAPELTARLRAYLVTLGAAEPTDASSVDRLLEQLRQRVGFVS